MSFHENEPTTANVTDMNEHMPPVNLVSSGPAERVEHVPHHQTGFGRKHGEYIVQAHVQLEHPVFSD